MTLHQQTPLRRIVDHPYLPALNSVVAGPFVITSQTLTLRTDRAPHFLDLTPTVTSFVQQTDVLAGTVLVFSKHTTAAIVANEQEPLLLQDMADLLCRLAPPTARYQHDDLTMRTVNLTADEPKNGHAHCQHLFLGASIQFPVVDGCLDLGQWQRIFLVELDSPRTRQVVLQVSGIRAEHELRRFVE
jgi:secondary thiamine-phosphate synthase enzyme